MIELFHFLRPGWLALLPVVALTWWLVRRRDAVQFASAGNIAPHLKQALAIGAGDRQRLRPVDSVALLLVLLVCTAAGPTWSKQASPWFEETAPLIVALEVSDSMRANDLQPTRLDRARFKILDLIEGRTGGRTALIAYAGSAHVVVPPSKDIAVIKPFLEGLDPAIMPVAGNDIAAVLAQAIKLFGDQQARGTLLLVNDGFVPRDVDMLAAFAAQDGAPALAALVVGTDEGGVALLPDGSPVMSERGGRLDTSVDAALLRRVAAAGVEVVRASTDDADIRRLFRVIDSHLRQADDPDAEWLDAGWWLLWPALLLAVPWFRRGWTMQW